MHFSTTVRLTSTHFLPKEIIEEYTKDVRLSASSLLYFVRSVRYDNRNIHLNARLRASFGSASKVFLEAAVAYLKVNEQRLHSWRMMLCHSEGTLLDLEVDAAMNEVVFFADDLNARLVEMNRKSIDDSNEEW